MFFSWLILLLFCLGAIFVPADFLGEALFSSVSIVPFLLHWISEIPSVEHARDCRACS
jgi:hypothetical protein